MFRRASLHDEAADANVYPLSELACESRGRWPASSALALGVPTGVGVGVAVGVGVGVAIGVGVGVAVGVGV
jgi:hypothetical protein